MIRKIIFVLLLTCLPTLIFSQNIEKSNKVMMYEKEIIIPTYNVGEPDLNPFFYLPANYQEAQGHIYPYPLINKLTDEKINKKYNAIFLENQYVKICVLPELGGRIYIAKDKTNGYNFFYHNQVIKPALIGMNGAWISGGVEWNIPHHHRVSSFMPVDYKLIENSDGSKTIWVGEYEKRHQTRWVVGLTLYPGKSYIQTDLKLFNVTSVENSFLIWANTAEHANKDYQVIFPPDVNQVTFHRKVYFSDWPISHQIYDNTDFRNIDISWWKNTSQPTSFFIRKSDFDFMGGIDHGKNAGTVMVANHHIVTGKKMWNWGNNKVQRLWDKMLTDKDGPYLELMVGAYSDNQPDYTWNMPGQTRQARMYFYPSQNMNSIKNADENFAINLEVKGNKALIEANSSSVHKNNKIVLYRSGKVVYEKPLSIAPDKAFSDNVKIADDFNETDLKLAILSSDGKELISYQPIINKPSELPQPYVDPVSPKDMETVDELYLAGLRLELFYNPDFRPEAYYMEALRREPKNVLVNTQLGIWYLKRWMDTEAEKYLRIASEEVENNFTTPKYKEPLYYLGLSLFNQGKLKEAYDILNQSAWKQGWASPSYFKIALMDCINGDFEKALSNIELARLANPINIEALQLKGFILRSLKQNKQALETLQSIFKIDPLNFVALNEMRLISDNLETGKSAKEWKNLFIEKMRDEPDNYLEVSTRYANAGLYKEAIDVLELAKKSETQKLQDYPMIYYYLGYMNEQIGNNKQALNNFKKAASLPIKYCFPYGRFSAKVLETALLIKPNDDKAHYYLGNVYCDNLPEKAETEWENAIKLNNEEAIYFRNLAFVAANIFNEMDKAISNIETAISLNSDDPLYFTEADLYYSYTGQSVKKRLKILKNHLETVKKSDQSFIPFLKLNSFMGNYDYVIEELNKRHFHIAERIEINVHNLWSSAYIMRGRQNLSEKKYDQALEDFKNAMEFPQHLEIAFDGKAAIALYFTALTYQAKGDSLNAKIYFKKMIDYQVKSGWGEGEWPEISYYKGMAAQSIGMKHLAKRYFQKLIDGGNKLLNKTYHGAWDWNSVVRRKVVKNDKAQGYYSLGLGNLGFGFKQQAEQMFKKVIATVPDNSGAHEFLISN